MWADFEGQAGDHVQIFGWAPIAEDAAADAQDELVEPGLDPREARRRRLRHREPRDDASRPTTNGYGMTYLFGDGWVMLADTKQGLVLIEWPRA